MTAEKVGITNQPLSEDTCALHPQAQPEVAVLGLESHCCQSPRATDPEVPMDPPLGQTESTPRLSDSQTGDLDRSLLHSPAEIASPTYKRQIEVVSALSDHVREPVSLTDKIIAPLSDISSCLSQETIADLDCWESVEPLPPSRDLTGCFSLCSEPVPNVFDCHTQDSDISVPNYFGSTTSHHSSSLIQDNKATDIFRSLSHLSDSLTETDTATEPDLYIFESGTQDFILSPQNPSLDPQQIDCPVYPSSSQPGDKGTDLGRDIQVLILSHCDSTEMAAQSHPHFSEEGDPAAVDSESELGQHVGLGPPAVAVYEEGLRSSSDMSQDKAEVSGLTPKAQQSDSPNELWLDTCQYLAGEDKNSGDDGVQTILDESGHSVIELGVWATSDTSPPGDTKVSGYLPDESDWIGWSLGDMGGWGPPVERWSSVDSWASALSDWAAIITAPPEDISTAFTEIGAEIDSLTQALAEAETHTDTRTDTYDKTDKLTETLDERQDQETPQAESEAQAHPQSPLPTQSPMAIQDQALEPQPIPESSILPGQSGFSSTLPEPAELSELQDREGTRSDGSYISTSTTQGDKEPGEIHQSTQVECSPCAADKHSSLDSSCATLACPGGYGADMSAASIPASPSPAVLDEIATDLSQLGYVEAMETDIYIRNEENPVLLHITEDTDEGLERQNAPAPLNIEEPFRDVVCEVTEEHSVPQLGSVAKTGGKGSYEPAVTVSGFSNSEAETPKVDTGGAKGSEHAHPQTNTHVSAVDTPPRLHANAHTHVSSDTSRDLDKTCQGEPERRVPQFIMPVAPLSIGPSPLFCQTSNTLEGHQDCAKRSLNDIRDHTCAHTQPCVPTFEGSTNKSLLEDHKEKLFIHKKDNTINSAEKSSPDEQKGELTVYSDPCLNRGSLSFTLHSGDTTECFLSDRNTSTITQEISDLSRELSNLVVITGDHFLVSEKDRIAYITLDLDDPFASKPITTGLQFDQATDQPESNQKKALKMPHKTHKSTAECKTRSKKDKSTGYHQASKKQDNLPHHLPVQQPSKIQDAHPLMGGAHTKGLEDKETEPATLSKTIVESEKVITKPHGKKKKKHTQSATVVKSEVEPLAEVENGAKQKAVKGRIEVFEDKLGAKGGKTKDKPIGFPSKKDSVQSDTAEKKTQQPQAKASQGEKGSMCGIDHQPTNSTSPPNDDAIKRRRLSQDKFGKMVSMLESKLTKPEVSIKAKREKPKTDVGDACRRAYSEVVKQKTHKPKEEPKVVQPIQAMSVSEDPQSLCLWCQFTAVFSNYTVTWSRECTVLTEIKRSAGDESRVSLTISKASHKDLGKYQCRLSSSLGSATLDYLLTYEVLSEIVIPASPKNIPPALAELVGREEDIHCSRLMFREDFLSHQYFGENQHASIITEKDHFGEGMHRRAFRTKLQAGLVPLFTHGHPCVLKVHNAITYGTNNNEELIQKNFSLAVEECHVQNTAREYIKAYSAVAQSADAFGEVPEIIPIYLVHRPSNDIPYATLEEELLGNFVKYSVRDGKEINLMRRDSEAGQKCCAFQHWVYYKTDGNLLITDMQGVGMKLTDVGIATCKKGYKGFRGNCATSFIDQFKALHQCNKYCEILDLKSLQPKPRKSVSAPKPKPPPSAAAKKKTFGPTVKDKS